ncbi:hypothetical protein AGLY_001642 [Aphis glycines]|uniref:Uncharacterized protein n=1 Tax=Aphis glycines TaxID=307491 RepID=A0A6G0U4T4_APHGL|nr:hypothetical protein AGLY_001642 [Aphis glycines]
MKRVTVTHELLLKNITYTFNYKKLHIKYNMLNAYCLEISSYIWVGKESQLHKLCLMFTSKNIFKMNKRRNIIFTITVLCPLFVINPRIKLKSILINMIQYYPQREVFKRFYLNDIFILYLNFELKLLISFQNYHIKIKTKEDKKLSMSYDMLDAQRKLQKKQLNKSLIEWVPLNCIIGVVWFTIIHRSITFESYDRYNCIRKMILNGDDLSA